MPKKIIKQELSICQFLQTVDFYLLIRYVEDHCYQSGRKGFRYDPLLMLKPVIVQLYRKLPYRKVITSLTEEDCRCLEVPKSIDEYILPASSTIHHFIKYRLKEEGLHKLM